MLAKWLWGTGSIATAAALAIVFGAPAGAEPAKTVMFHGYDSRGADTKKCLSLNGNGPQPRATDAPFIFAACDKTDIHQRFYFSSTGGNVGTLGAQVFANGDGLACAGVPTGAKLPNGGWTVGAALVSTGCQNVDPNMKIAWRWESNRLLAMGSPAPGYCLTFVQARGPAARLGDCSKPETLTAWDMVIDP